MAPSPFAPITIRSACCLEAASMISSAGFPSGHRGSAVNPAWISFCTLCSTNLRPTSFNPGYLIHGIVDLTVMGANGLRYPHMDHAHMNRRPLGPCRWNDPAETCSAQTPGLWLMRPIHRSPR